MSSHVETVKRYIATLESMLTSQQPYASRGLEIEVSLPAQMGKLLCLLLDEGNTSFKHADEFRAWDERMVRDGIDFDRRLRPIVRVEKANPVKRRQTKLDPD